VKDRFSRNAQRRLRALLGFLFPCGLAANPEVFVIADQKFDTVAESPVAYTNPPEQTIGKTPARGLPAPSIEERLRTRSGTDRTRAKLQHNSIDRVIDS
jgi:hypothetical protein